MSELFVGFFWTQSVEPFTLSTKELRWRWQCFILKSSLMCEWDTFVLRTHNPDHALMNFNNLKFIVKPLIGYLQFKELRPCSYFVTHNCIIKIFGILIKKSPTYAHSYEITSSIHSQNTYISMKI